MWGGRGRERERVFAAAASAAASAAAAATPAFVAMFADGMAGRKKLKERDRDRLSDR